MNISENNNTNKIFFLILANYTIWDGLSQKTISRYCPFKIMQSVIYGKKYFNFSKYFLYIICNSGAVVYCRVLGYKSNECRFIPHLYSLVYSIHGTSRIKLRILECFTLYLRNGWSINLKAIRCIERNTRPISWHCPFKGHSGSLFSSPDTFLRMYISHVHTHM